MPEKEKKSDGRKVQMVRGVPSYLRSFMLPVDVDLELKRRADIANTTDTSYLILVLRNFLEIGAPEITDEERIEVARLRIEREQDKIRKLTAEKG